MNSTIGTLCAIDLRYLPASFLQVPRATRVGMQSEQTNLISQLLFLPWCITSLCVRDRNAFSISSLRSESAQLGDVYR